METLLHYVLQSKHKRSVSTVLNSLLQAEYYKRIVLSYSINWYLKLRLDSIK